MSKKDKILQFERDEKPEKSNLNNQTNNILKIVLSISILILFLLSYIVFIQIKEIKKENNNLKEEIKKLKINIEPVITKFNENINIDKYFINNKSVIMKDSEFDFIHLAIKSRTDKKVKELRKIYQASFDGDGAINFHSRCDNIPNTLVLIQSKGNRRFGGFVSETWESTNGDKAKDDKKAFLFSLDKQKIYAYNNNGLAIINNKDCGPNFGEIIIYPYSIQEKQLKTRESLDSKYFYKFYGDKEALSESNDNLIYAKDYEVFQVIFD